MTLSHPSPGTRDPRPVVAGRRVSPAIAEFLAQQALDQPVQTLDGPSDRPLIDMVYAALRVGSSNRLLARDGRVMVTDVARILVREQRAFISRDEVEDALDTLVITGRATNARDDLTGTGWYRPVAASAPETAA